MYNTIKPYSAPIKRIKETWKTPYVTVTSGVYPILKKKFDYPEVQHTDGIGTKGEYHWERRTFKSAVIDAFAMNLNDLALMGAIPYSMQNHIVLPTDDEPAAAEMLNTMVRECKKRKIAMTGGEISVHEGSHAVDVSMTMCAFIKEKRTNRIKAGDVLVGLKSSGVHSNGLTRAREIFGGKFRDDFVKPTAIYIDTVLDILSKHTVHGMMHITGGAFSKLHGLMNGVDVSITHPEGLAPQDIFYEMHERGEKDDDMYVRFNCGVGYVLSMPPADAEKVVAGTRGAHILGEAKRSSKKHGRVHITSAFTGRTVVL